MDGILRMNDTYQPQQRDKDIQMTTGSIGRGYHGPT